MSYNYNFHPKVNNPHLSNNIPQLRSGGFQAPFFFGGSQVPTALGIAGRGFHKGSPSKTHIGDMDFTAKKGTKSRTHKGDMNFTTKKGDKVFHQDGHYVSVPSLLPFQK